MDAEDFKFIKFQEEDKLDVEPKHTNSTHQNVVSGFVKWFNEQKGYGFIEQENGRDLFVHYKECRGKIRQGDRVEYVLGEGAKGPCATKVRVKTPAVSVNNE